MKRLIAVAIFGISFGMYGCSSEAKFAGMPMAATVVPAASPGAAVQVTADANVLNETVPDDDRKFVEPSKWVSLKASAGPGGSVFRPSDKYEIGKTASLTARPDPGFAFDKWSEDCAKEVSSTCSLTMDSDKVATASFKSLSSSKWVDVTTTNGTTLSTCIATPANCTMQDPITSFEWSNMRVRATWQEAMDHCSALTYNGSSEWRLPKKDELIAAHTNGIVGAAKEGWITAGEMSGYFWSSSSLATNPGDAWGVGLAGGSAANGTKTSDQPRGCLCSVVRVCFPGIRFVAFYFRVGW